MREANYIVVSENNIEDLVETVKDRLNRGWVTKGGICTVIRAHYEEPDLFYQALVKQYKPSVPSTGPR